MSLAISSLEHMLGSLGQADVHDQPYSHLYVEQFFPGGLYWELLDNLPAPADYYPMAKKRLSDTGGYTRMGFDLTSERVTTMSNDARDVFLEVIEGLSSPEFKRAVFGLLATDLSTRYGVPKSQVPDIPARCVPKLFRDTSGYRIDPHPDTRRKIVTMMIYLPRDESQRSLGTSVYRRRLSLRGLIDSQSKFEEVKRFPFLPNSGFAFVVTNRLGKRSWHGREPLPPNSGVRNSLAMTFYAPDDKACEGY
ncbi:MAG: hypothetical protein KDB14_20270 [Planctomycetales bacterium]|nr:hypothetical protein [Planctomycetales bacterium]